MLVTRCFSPEDYGIEDEELLKEQQTDIQPISPPPIENFLRYWNKRYKTKDGKDKANDEL